MLPVGRDWEKNKGRNEGWSALGAASLSYLPTCLVPRFSVSLTDTQTHTYRSQFCKQPKEPGEGEKEAAGIVRTRLNELPGTPSTASTQGMVLCLNVTIMIEADPVRGWGWRNRWWFPFLWDIQD